MVQVDRVEPLLTARTRQRSGGLFPCAGDECEDKPEDEKVVAGEIGVLVAQQIDLGLQIFQTRSLSFLPSHPSGIYIRRSSTNHRSLHLLWESKYCSAITVVASRICGSASSSCARSNRTISISSSSSRSPLAGARPVASKIVTFSLRKPGLG